MLYQLYVDRAYCRLCQFELEDGESVLIGKLPKYGVQYFAMPCLCLVRGGFTDVVLALTTPLVREDGCPSKPFPFRLDETIDDKEKKLFKDGRT